MWGGRGGPPRQPQYTQNKSKDIDSDYFWSLCAASSPEMGGGGGLMLGMTELCLFQYYTLLFETKLNNDGY